MIPIRGRFGIIYEAVSGPLQLSGEPRFGWEEVVVIAGLPWVEPSSPLMATGTGDTAQF
jgi:hypothetical protein